MVNIVILNGARTAMGGFQGSLLQRLHQNWVQQ